MDLFWYGTWKNSLENLLFAENLFVKFVESFLLKNSRNSLEIYFQQIFTFLKKKSKTCCNANDVGLKIIAKNSLKSQTT